MVLAVLYFRDHLWAILSFIINIISENFCIIIFIIFILSIIGSNISNETAEEWYNKGVALYYQEKYNEAIECYDKALKIDPNYVDAWYNKGVALKNLGKYNEAIMCYDRVLEIDPGYVKAWNNKGDILYKLGRYNEAIKCYDKSLVIRDDPKIKKIKEEIKSELRPKLRIKLLNTSFTLNRWEKVKMEILNKGSVMAKNVDFTFSDDITVRNLPKIKVNPKSKKIVEFNLRPNVSGEVPLEVEIRCKDHLNKEYKFKETITLDVKERVEEITPEKGISPAEFTPKPTTPKTFPPELSDRYVEVEYIGKGGFARVFKAKRKDGKEVAVKIPISLDESTGKSFLKEIENWTKLNHKNIVKVYHYNILPIPYFEMELCDQSLEDLDKPLDPEKAAWIIFHTIEGLKHAHSKNIIHRDLKPQNILLKEGIPKIGDWGLSKVMTESSSATTGKGFTPLYASPEQINNESKDERTDIWQIGVIFYELTTGELPFKGDGFIEIVTAIVTKDPIPPSKINPGAKGVEKIIMKCLEKDKTKRYQSVEELQRDLSEYLGIKYKESLKLSVSRRDFKRSAYYCSELLLINMKINNMIGAYKYTSDLLNYTDGEIKQEVKELHEHLKYRIENGIEDIPEELIKVAEVIVHRVRVGL
ncbi:protein kinase [Methanothermococcus sp. SCGC AD-155-C09]|nr:protein kinase [Methanothermococcus sp. SCGC AD-155-C09]